MQHATLKAAEAIGGGAIRAMLSHEAAHRMVGAGILDTPLVSALDRAYGAHGWFVFWDEDLAGHAIPGTITLSFGGETLVVG